MKRISPIISYLLSIHLLNLAFFSFFRLLFILFNQEQISDSGFRLLLESFIRGVQYDNLVASYAMAAPLLIWLIAVFVNRWNYQMVKLNNLYFILVNAILFMINAADIRYFGYFSAHLNVGAFAWFKYGMTTVEMLVEDRSNYVFMIVYFAAIIGFSIIVWELGKTMKKRCSEYYPKFPPMNTSKKIGLTLVAFGLCFTGIRGSFQRYPLKVSNSYFSTNSFFNQIPLSPPFYLLKSYTYDKRARNCADHLMSEEKALSIAKTSLGASILPDGKGVERYQAATEKPIRPHIVVVLMESMSKANLSLEHKGKSLTPFLNQMKDSAYYFENFYSAGVHTNSGIVATLYSVPAQFNKQMMHETPIVHYGGMPQELQNIGYQTLFFVTGNPQYDSMNSYLRENNVERIFSSYDYPSAKVVNNFGVQDDYLFEFGVNKLNELNQEGKPFFATFLTVSNHEPIVVPSKFKNVGANARQDIIAFADNSIKEFMEQARATKWFENTIFVFLGDHGTNSGCSNYDMPLDYNRIPLIIYSKLFKDMPRTFSQLGGQIDVFPTLMGLINHSFVNKTLGVDLLKEKRPCMFFTNDTQLGCISASNLYIRNLLTNKDCLLGLNDEKPVDVFQQYSDIGNQLKDYALSMTIVGNLPRKKLRNGNKP